MSADKPAWAPDGSPCTIIEWANYVEDHAVKFVADTYLPRGRVVTIFTGMDVDHFARVIADADALALIYETAIFRGATPDHPVHGAADIQGEWPTREIALQRHEEIVERFKKERTGDA